MTDARRLPPTGQCHSCGRPTTGERRLCGLCLARRERPVSTPTTRAREEAAHQRALTRLAEQHPEQYRALYREELDRA